MSVKVWQLAELLWRSHIFADEVGHKMTQIFFLIFFLPILWLLYILLNAADQRTEIRLTLNKTNTFISKYRRVQFMCTCSFDSTQTHTHSSGRICTKPTSSSARRNESPRCVSTFHTHTRRLHYFTKATKERKTCWMNSVQLLENLSLCFWSGKNPSVNKHPEISNFQLNLLFISQTHRADVMSWF